MISMQSSDDDIFYLSLAKLPRIDIDYGESMKIFKNIIKTDINLTFGNRKINYEHLMPTILLNAVLFNHRARVLDTQPVDKALDFTLPMVVDYIISALPYLKYDYGRFVDSLKSNMSSLKFNIFIEWFHYQMSNPDESDEFISDFIEYNENYRNEELEYVTFAILTNLIKYFEFPESDWQFYIKISRAWSEVVNLLKLDLPFGKNFIPNECGFMVALLYDIVDNIPYYLIADGVSKERFKYKINLTISKIYETSEAINEQFRIMNAN